MALQHHLAGERGEREVVVAGVGARGPRPAAAASPRRFDGKPILIVRPEWDGIRADGIGTAGSINVDGTGGISRGPHRGRRRRRRRS